MKRIIAAISAATAVLAFYNEATRAGFIKPLNVKPISLNPLGKEYKGDSKQ